MEEPLLDLEKVCRVCLQEGETTCVFQEDISKKIMECTSVQVGKNDGLPAQICDKCSANLLISYQFKKLCEVSDTRLRRQLIKSEPTTNQPVSVKKTECIYLGCDPIIELYRGDKIDPFAQLPEHPTIDCKVEPKTEVITCTVDLSEVQDGHEEGMNLAVEQQEAVVVLPYQRGRIVPVQQMAVEDKSKSTDLKDIKGEEKMLRCQFCNGNFIWWKMEVHLKTHIEEGVYKCSKCDKTFPKLDRLKIHRLTHTGFNGPVPLTAHMESHSGERPFGCSTCKRNFKFWGHLTKHMKLCTGYRKKPIERVICNVCHVQFSNMGYLAKHAQTAHPYTSLATCISPQKTR